MRGLQNTLAELFRVFGPVAVVAAGVGGFVVFGQRPERTPRQVDEAVAAVETAVVEASDGRFTIEVDGVALSFRQVTHAAEVAGRVTEKVADGRPGHYIEAGEFLLQIDPTDYELEVERLTVVIEQAGENLAEVDVDLVNTQALVALTQEELELQEHNLKRVQGLIAKGAATDTRLDEARLQELASRNALRTLENQSSALRQRKNTLRAAKKLAQTQLRRAAVDVERARVSAPLSGTLVTVDVEAGDYVTAGDPLFTINDTQTMEVSCQLRIDELYWVWLHSGKFGLPAESESLPLGAEATFEIPNLPVEVAFPFRGVEFVWNGVLSRYDGTGLDPATRTVPCRVRVDEPTEVRLNGNAASAAVVPPTLFSGMYVKVRIPIDASVSMLSVPLTAVRPRGEVWVVREGRLAIVPVEVARKENDRALLRVTREGPQVGERVITSPLAAVEAGMPVRDLTAALAARVTADALVKNTDRNKSADSNESRRTKANQSAEGDRQTTEDQQ